MKKAMIGVGIGCGVLLLVGVVGAIAGVRWLKGKAEDVVASAEKAEESQKRAQQLDAKFAFARPPAGQPVKLTESRFQEYLAVRAALTPVLEKYEAEGRKLNGEDEGEKPGLGDAMKATSMMVDLVADVQAVWLGELEARKMSPAEFHAITAALFSSGWGAAAGELQNNQRAMLTATRDALRQQAKDPDASAEARTAATEQAAEIERQLAALPAADAVPNAVVEIHAANMAILERFKDEFEKKGNPGVDVLLIGSEGANLGDALQNAAPRGFGAVGDDETAGDGSERPVDMEQEHAE